jgi:hypothetical protein
MYVFIQRTETSSSLYLMATCSGSRPMGLWGRIRFERIVMSMRITVGRLKRVLHENLTESVGSHYLEFDLMDAAAAPHIMKQLRAAGAVDVEDLGYQGGGDTAIGANVPMTALDSVRSLFMDEWGYGVFDVEEDGIYVG